jgi:hypothetical protein
MSSSRRSTRCARASRCSPRSSWTPSSPPPMPSEDGIEQGAGGRADDAGDAQGHRAPARSRRRAFDVGVPCLPQERRVPRDVRVPGAGHRAGARDAPRSRRAPHPRRRRAMPRRMRRGRRSWVRVGQASSALLPGVRGFMVVQRLRALGEVTACEPRGRGVCRRPRCRSASRSRCGPRRTARRWSRRCAARATWSR